MVVNNGAVGVTINGVANGVREDTDGPYTYLAYEERLVTSRRQLLPSFFISKQALKDGV